MRKLEKWDVYVGGFCYRVGLSRHLARKVKSDLQWCVCNVNILKHRSQEVG